MGISLKFSMIAAAAFSAALLGAQNYKVQTSVSRDSAIFNKGEEIVFSASLLDGTQNVAGKKLRCFIQADGGVNVKKEFTTSDKPVTMSYRSETPNWIRFSAELVDEKGKTVKDKSKKSVKGMIGAMVAPLEIRNAGPEPKDFNAFWAKQRAELNKVPVKAKLEKVSINKRADKNFDCYDIKIDCAGSMPVSGYLAIPKNAKPGTLAAVVSYHGAGVRSSNKSYRSGAISLDVNAHGIDNGKSKDFYANLNKNELKGYPHRNKADKDKFYFKDMYLRVMRALDYVKTRPEWDKKRLVVCGGSQGGGQSIAAAALDPQVTLAIAAVPALSDHAGCFAKPARQNGWPRLFKLNKNGQADNPKVVETAAYFDNVFFAKRIRCEIWFSTGFIDNVCVPTGVYAAFNNLKSAKKDIEPSPAMGHNAPAKRGYKRIGEYIK